MTNVDDKLKDLPSGEVPGKTGDVKYDVLANEIRQLKSKGRRQAMALFLTLAGGVAYLAKDTVEGAALSRLDSAMDGIEEADAVKLDKIEADLISTSDKATATSLASRAKIEAAASQEAIDFAAMHETYIENIVEESKEKVVDLQSEDASRTADLILKKEVEIAAIVKKYADLESKIHEEIAGKITEVKVQSSLDLIEIENTPQNIESKKLSDLAAVDSSLESVLGSAQFEAEKGKKLVTENPNTAFSKSVNSTLEAGLGWVTGVRRFQGDSTITEMIDCKGDKNTVILVTCEDGQAIPSPEDAGPYSSSVSTNAEGLHNVRVPGFKKFDADALCEDVDGKWAVKLEQN